MSRADLQDVDAVVALFDRAAEAQRASAHRVRSTVRIPARGRLLATGDVHDNPMHLQKIIHLAGLAKSPDHHVVLQEMIHGERLINGMDFSYRTLGVVAQLVVEHPDQVHPLLANHELAQMTGRGVSKGAGNSVELFNDALEYVFGDDWTAVSEAIIRFIAAMPLALVSESGVLCAHSLPAPRMMKSFDPAVLERDLAEEDYRAPTGAAHVMVWGRKYTPEQVEDLAERWGVKLFCLGHEHVEMGIDTRGPRVVILNSDHEAGRVLPIDLVAPPTPDEALLAAIPLNAVSLRA